MIKRLMVLLAALMLLCTTAVAESPTIADYATPTVKSSCGFHTGMAIFQLVPDSVRAAMMQEEMAKLAAPIRFYSEKSQKKFAAALPDTDLDSLQLVEISGVSMEGDGDQLEVNICFLTPFQKGQKLLGVLSTTTVDFPIVPTVEDDGTLTFFLTGTMVRYLIRTEDGVLAVFIQ